MVIRKQGFTLVEVMVTVVIFMFVLIMLFQGVNAVTSTVSLGQRQSSLHRKFMATQRVMRNDVEGLLVHPNWPVYVGDLTATPPALALAFLKYRTGTEGETETEWVQYWIEAHPEEDRLRQWVRYSAAADSRAGYSGDWGTPITHDKMQKEILIDELMQIDCQVWTLSGQTIAPNPEWQQVEAVDVKLYFTQPLLRPELTPADDLVEWMWQEDGSWGHFRVRPQVQAGPVIKEVEDVP
jgi:type II secretory pathway pseudopilin PulG